MGTSHGLDVSSYQAKKDWHALAKSGLTFAFAKATEGQHTTDEHFRMHMQGITDASLVPGAYHYGWPNQNALTEADHYISVVREFAGRGFIHALDLERRTDGANYKGRTASQIRAYAKAWIEEVKEAFPGQRVGIYTSADDIANGHVPDNVDFIWYPAYPSGKMTYAEAEAHARPKPSGTNPLIWQFTSTPLDMNLAYLSPADLRKWAAGGNAQPDNKEDDMPEPKDLWSYKGQLNGKTDPHDAYAYLRGTNADVQVLVKKIDGLTATVSTLAKALAAANPNINEDSLVAKIKQVMAESSFDMDITVHDRTEGKTA